MLAVSYNPGYQSVIKDLKQSTRQRFVSLEFSFPAKEREAEIVRHESGTDSETAVRLVRLGSMTRSLKDAGLTEGASTRLLIHAAALMKDGIPPRTACGAAITETLTDDHELQKSLDELVSSIF